jgi:hypothetical protein
VIMNFKSAINQVTNPNLHAYLVILPIGCDITFRTIIVGSEDKKTGSTGGKLQMSEPRVPPTSHIRGLVVFHLPAFYSKLFLHRGTR